MDYPEFIPSFPFAISADNNWAALIFWVSMCIVLALIIWLLAKKVRAGETLKYEFITIIAHKFRTPLTHVKWSTDELVKDEQDPYKKQSLLDIQRSNEKLIQLTGTLIELTDADNTAASSYAFEHVYLCAFVRTVGDLYKDVFHEKNIFFSIQCPPTDIFVKIDTQRMEFVLQTLLENALSYTPPGKNVDVTVSRIGHQAVVSMTDHGIGISGDDLPHVFTKFYRGSNARNMDTEGFGVGLYLARDIVRRHKGKIEVTSAGVDSGTTATLTLKVVR